MSQPQFNRRTFVSDYQLDHRTAQQARIQIHDESSDAHDKVMALRNTPKRTSCRLAESISRGVLEFAPARRST